MWALGDYHTFAKQTVWELGPILVEACGISPDSACSTWPRAPGTSPSAPPRPARASSPPTSRLRTSRAGRREARAHGVELEWVEADAEALPFGDGEFDVVTSSLGAMFAPDHQSGGRRAPPRVPARRHDRVARLHARGPGRRVLRVLRALRPAASAGSAAADSVGKREPRPGALRRPRESLRADPPRVRRAGGEPACLRRALPGRRSGPWSRSARSSPTSPTGLRRSTATSSSSPRARTAARPAARPSTTYEYLLVVARKRSR